jgi:hypothetical protein
VCKPNESSGSNTYHRRVTRTKRTRKLLLLALRIINLPLVLCATMMVSASQTTFAAPRETLHLDVFIGDADSWNVTSTLIYGKNEAILVDSQFRIAQAKKLADQVAARGRRLKPSSSRIPITIITSERRCFMNVSPIRRST